MIKINIKPLSVNQCWQGKRYRTNTYIKYFNNLLILLPKYKGIDFDKKLKLDISFGFSSAAADIDNPLKPFIDVLQKKYKFNDNQIYQLNVSKEKVKKGKEFIKFKINEL